MLYEKVHGSSASRLQTSTSSSSTLRSSSVFLFITYRRHTHTSSSSSSSLSSELKFYLRNDLQSTYDKNHIENLNMLAWWKSIKN